MLIEHDVELVPYACRRCGRSWSSRFEVTRWQDGLGSAYEVYSVAGMIVPSPRLGPACPFCGAETPTLMSAGHAAKPGMGARVAARPPRAAVTPTKAARDRRARLEPRTRRFP